MQGAPKRPSTSFACVKWSLGPFGWSILFVTHAWAWSWFVAIVFFAVGVNLFVAGFRFHVDNGLGGAKIGPGSGPTGLSDRAEALGGRFNLDGPYGRGTTISIDLPITTPSPTF